MNRQTRKILSLVMAIALALGVFTFAPMTALADTLELRIPIGNPSTNWLAAYNAKFGTNYVEGNIQVFIMYSCTLGHLNIINYGGAFVWGLGPGLARFSVWTEDGWGNAIRSDTMEVTVYTTAPCADPVASPMGGEFASFPQSVTLTCPTTGADAKIHYTTDGSVPTGSDPFVASGGAVSVSAGETLKAISISPYYADSGVMSETYTQMPTCAAPTVSPVGGSYAAAQSVTLSCTTPGAEIHYTLDGSDPTTNPAKLTYSGAINVPMGTTLKAYATLAGMIDSAVLTAAYTQWQNNNSDGYIPPNSLRIVNNLITITQLDGTRTKMGVQATGGNPPYTYQWQRKGSWIDIPSATSAEFTWEDLTPGQTYTVRCVVKDRLGNTVTSPEKTFIAGEGLSAFPVKGEVTSKNVNVRPEPNTKGKRLAWLQTGDEISILGYTAPKGYPYGFYKIAWENPAGFAYVSADYVSVTFGTPLNASILGRMYLQSRMNTAKKYRLATLNKGDATQLLGRYKAWWVAEYNGEMAYIKNGKYIQP